MEQTYFVSGLIAGVIVSHAPYLSTMVGVSIGLLLHDQIWKHVSTQHLMDSIRPTMSRWYMMWQGLGSSQQDDQ